jgi:uncharacterized cupin superfamily protein
MPKPAIIRFDDNAKTEHLPDFPESEIAEGTRAQRGFKWLDDETTDLVAGIWEAGASISPWMNYPVDEFMMPLEGEIIIVEDGKETRAGPGESLVIPKGTRCRYRQDGHVRKFYVYLGNLSGFADPSGLTTLKIDPKVKLQPSTPPSTDILHSPVPTQNAHEYFMNATGDFTVGVWDTTGYHRKLINFPRHELMHLLKGSVTFTDDKGATQTFKKGDTFFVPLGTPNSWKSEGYLRKIYCIFQPGQGVNS